MHIPPDIISLISSFNGTDKQLATEKGLKVMFLKSNRFFTWNYAREDSIHRFFEIYDINSHSDFVKEHITENETNLFYSDWATETQVLKMLSKIKI